MNFFSVKIDKHLSNFHNFATFTFFVKDKFFVESTSLKKLSEGRHVLHMGLLGNCLSLFNNVQ